MNNENHKNEAKIFTLKRKIAYNEKKPSKIKISAFDTNDPLNLHSLFEDLKRSDLSDDLILAGIIRAKQVLYRDIRNLNPTGPEFCQSDDTVFRNKVSTNINIFSKILEFLTLKCTSSRTIFVCFNDESLPNLFSLLKSEDEIERKNVCQTLKNIFDKKILCNEITRLLENEFQLFYVGSRTHIGMDLILNLFYYAFTVTKSISFCSFVKNILFFIKKAQIEYFDDFKKIVLGFCTGNLKKSKFTLNFIYHHFEDVTYLRRVVLVEIIVDLFIFWKSHLKGSVIGLTDLINSALSSGHHLLLEEVIGFFEHKEIYDLIKEQVDEFLPLIFDKLYGISKKYWRRKGKAKVFKNISLILNMSHCVFEKCLIDYNRRRYGECEIKNEIIKNEVIEVVEKCLEYSELEKQNEEKFNKRMGDGREI